VNFEEIGKQLDSAYKSGINEIGCLNMNKLESKDLVLISKGALLNLIVNQDYFKRLWLQQK
jgi:hypothetical protein